MLKIRGGIMLNPLIRKLARGAELSEDDRRILEEATTDVRQIRPRQDLIHDGDGPNAAHLILEGFACRYKTLPEGQRQIMAFLVPGDICDLHVAILGAMDHGIGTLSACTVAFIPQTTVAKLTEKHPAIIRALWWNTLVDEGILREWLVSMGRRPADKQMAHLFCELLVRLESVGLAKDNGFEFPLTQEELADALGLSPVHTNRVLTQLRDDGLIRISGKRLDILDLGRLCAYAGFDPAYLHLEKRSAG